MAPDKNSTDPALRYSSGTRWFLFFFGLWVMTVGIALTVHADLGTTPISTVPAVLATATPLSFGVLTILLSLIFVLGQVLLLRGRFAPFQFWQLLVAVIFGALCDLSLAMTSFLQPESYLSRWLLVVLGAVLVSFGVFTQVLPRILYGPGEGIVVALAMVTRWRFGTVKQCFDWSQVALAVLLSLILVGELVGVREGTVFAAFAVGGLVKIYQRIYETALRRRHHP